MATSINGIGDPQLCIHQIGDGKLFRYGVITRFSNDTKKQLIDLLIDVITQRANPSIKEFGIRGITIIKDDTGLAQNFQAMDGLLADDVLADICDMLTRIKDYEVIDTTINHLCEQMADMIRTNGFCPTGRCTRVFQVYMVLRDALDGIHLPG
jgi:hypothetical protein